MDLLCTAKIQFAKATSSAVTPGTKLSAYEGSSHKSSSLQIYCWTLQNAITTRPKIHLVLIGTNKTKDAFSDNRVSIHAPTIGRVKRILTYLEGTVNHGLYRQKPTELDLLATVMPIGGRIPMTECLRVQCVLRI